MKIHKEPKNSITREGFLTEAGNSIGWYYFLRIILVENGLRWSTAVIRWKSCCQQEVYHITGNIQP